MSNDLILSIKSSLAKVGVDAETLAVAGKSGGGGGGGSKRISIKGGVFRKYVGGKEVAAIEDRHMNVIFVKMAPDPSRTYYTDAYREGEKVSPACWSSNSKTPDPEVRNPQSSSCDTCQWSVKGSGQGGSGAACRLSWRTAVVLPNDPSGDVMQLVLPATSAFAKEDSGKWGFRPYCQYLANNNISAKHVITKMQFDTKSPVPKVMFSPVSAIDDSLLPALEAQSNSQAAENAVKLNVYQADEGEAPAVPEPTLRKSDKETVPAEDVSDVIKKWSKKK
jgi:hypothetical protein